MPSLFSRRCAASVSLLLLVAACSAGSSFTAEVPASGNDAGEISTTGADASLTTTRHDAAMPDDASPADDAGDASEDADADSSIDAAPPPDPAVRYVGRFDTSDPAGPKVGWPGARIIAQFEGTQASATFTDAERNSQHARWDVIVDGVVGASPLVLSAGQATYALTSGLAEGVHTVELYRLTEGQYSQTQFLGFDFGGGRLLAPPAAPNRRIEFVVDSGGDGYGSEGTAPCTASAANQNERLSYSGLTAHDLGADHHDLGYGGRGVYWDYTRSDPEVYGVDYPRTLPTSSTPTWDSTKFVPDVVWVQLGANDWDQPSPGDPAPTLTNFTNRYGALVDAIRSAHPDAHIFCSVATSLNDDYPAGYKAYTNVVNGITGIVNARNAAGDAKVYVHVFTRAVSSANLTGCASHPSLAWHRHLADEVIADIKDKTKWM